MDVASAIRLLDTTFKSSFDMERFEYFLIELFNNSKIHRVNQINFVRNDFKDYVNGFYSLGYFNDDLGGSIGFYVAELAKGSTRDRARTMQRNLIAQFLKNQNRDAALVAFYEPNSEDWRFSFVKLEYELGDSGIKEKLSSPKRHSFLVGPNEPNHTCQKQFLDLLVSESKLSLEQIEDAFNIENVTDEFFKEYKRLFLDLIDSLDEIKDNDVIVKEEFDNKNIKSSDFAKKLMGQLVFIYFLQKKGWLGVEKDADWGTGPKNFLRRIYENCVDEGKNFFNDVLEHLFYQGLSEEVSDEHYSKFGYRVPFLNGGLFEPINNYDWMKTDVVLKNDIFEEILDTFDKFNFTIKEDEPLEKEVAVDPEMLGKVFENLLEVIDRKSKGAFYTPRHIVHYMCQENLISYLDTNSNIVEEDLRKFITKGDLAINSIIRAHEERKKYNGKQFTRIDLPDSIKDNSDELERLLRKVKVVDPAVGSGAFPVGMMNEIVKARYILRLLNDIDEVNMYDLKRETIENSLYGVDLELSATDVTKLRFWLSLIVDEEDIKQIRPLPNLDNHIMCGNSVIDGYHNIKLFDDSLIVRSAQTTLSMTPTERAFEELERKKKEFFSISGPNRKEELRKEIKELKWNFIETYLTQIGEKDLIEDIRKYKNCESRPFFVWEIEFSEIFKGENPGFDIVIGNPPYVRQEKIKEFKPYFKEHYKTFTGVADLYVYFFEKGLNILKEKGIFAFICSNKFTKAGYGKKLRELLLDNQIKIYNDFTGVKIFKEAQVDTSVIQIKKQTSDSNEIFVNNNFYLSQGYLNSDTFIFEKKEVLDLINKINSKGTQVKDLDIYINYGIKTGYDKAFVIDEKTKQILISQDKKNKEIIRPLIKGRDVKKGKIFFKNNYIILTKNGINVEKDYPMIFNYLLQFEDKLKKRSDQGNFWYNLRACTYYSDFDEEKLVYPNMAPSLYAVWDNKRYITNPKCYILNSKSIDLRYLSAILSSNVLNFIFKFIGSPLGNAGYDIHKKFVQRLPIVIAEEKVQINIANNMKIYFEVNEEFVNEVNSFLYKLIKSYNVNTISKKLEKYYELTSSEFLKELKNKKVQFNNDKSKNELITMFEDSVNKIKNFEKKINKIDENINEMIFEIYDLNPVEIKIIKENL